MSRFRPRLGPLARCLGQMRGHMWLQGVAISTLGVALAIVGCYLTLSLNLWHTLSRVVTGPALTLVLAEDVPAQRGQELAAKLGNRPLVSQAKYLSPAGALERFKLQLGPHRSLAEDLPANPLPASVELELTAPAPPELAAQLEALPGVAQVITSRPFLHRLEQAGYLVREAAMALGLLLFLGVVLLVANTVRLAVYARRDQLEIMELVGAGSFYIALPFLLEAIIQGLAAASLAVAVIWGLLSLLKTPAVLPLGLQAGQLLAFPPLVAPILGAVAVAASLIGGLLGIARALRQRKW